VGVEWLPLEEATRRQLRQFLSRVPVPPRGAAINHPRVVRGGSSARWLALRVGVGGVLLTGLLFALLAFSLRRENSQLRAILHVRNATLQQLEQQDARLRDALRATSAHLGVTSDEMTHLSQQVQVLEREAQQLGHTISRLEESHAQLGKERDALIERVLALEQERLTLVRRSVPRRELELAVREAVARRISHPSSPGEAVPTAETQWAIDGNRGYLLWMGRSTTAQSPVRIRVHEPELSPPLPQRSTSSAVRPAEGFMQPDGGGESP